MLKNKNFSAFSVYSLSSEKYMFLSASTVFLLSSPVTSTRTILEKGGNIVAARREISLR